MKSLIPLLFAAVLFTGCEKIEGQLNVTKDVKLKTTKGVARTVRVGTYSADLKANTKKKITLRLNNDGDEKYEFNVPDRSIPENGSFTVKSDVVGQPVDLRGEVKTTVTRGGIQQGFESCEYRVPVQYCSPRPGGGTTCSTRWETRYGRRFVRYYDNKTTKDVLLSISAANVAEESAQFQGDVAWIDRVVVSADQCM
jgi:hypothetical protein